MKFERHGDRWSAVAYTHENRDGNYGGSCTYYFNFDKDSKRWMWSQMNSVNIREPSIDEACRAIENAWKKAIVQVILEDPDLGEES